MQQLASGFRALKMNEKALGNASSQFEPGPIGSVDTFNSTWTYNDSINSAFHRAMNEDSDYSFVSGYLLYKNKSREPFEIGGR